MNEVRHSLVILQFEGDISRYQCPADKPPITIGVNLDRVSRLWLAKDLLPQILEKPLRSLLLID